MTEPKDKVSTIFFKGYTNHQCEFLPCHPGVKGEFNCLFCYCPLAFLECPGPYKVFQDKNGNTRKDCSACILPHNGYEKSWALMQKWLENPVPWSQMENKHDNCSGCGLGKSSGCGTKCGNCGCRT